MFNIQFFMKLRQAEATNADLPSQITGALWRRPSFPLLIGLVVLALIVGLGRARHAQADDANPVLAAWEKAQAAGSYHFTSDVTQITTPLATLGNVGRSSRQDDLHLEGQSDLAAATMTLHLWNGDGRVGDRASGVEVRMADGKTMLRQPGGVWRDQGDQAGVFAPNGDFLSFLAGLRDVQPIGREQRAGHDFTRYRFTLDGPAVAAYLRDLLQAEMTRRGELPAGVTLQSSNAYAALTGSGELWIDERVASQGLPLRLLLNLHFPPQRDEVVSGKIDTIFSNFRAAETGDTRQETRDTRVVIGNWQLALPIQSLVSCLLSLFPSWAMALLGGGFVGLVLWKRRSRSFYGALVVVIIFANVAGPLLQNYTLVAFLDTQAAKAAAAEKAASEQDAAQTAADLAALQSFDPTVDPAAVVETQAVAVTTTVNTALAVTVPTPEPVTAPDNGVDTDKDGLTDFLEERIGTAPTIADTDGDLMVDGQEVLGFSLAGRKWFSDPLQPDSNKDGQADAIELRNDLNGDNLPDDLDGDSLPDAFDDDNDGDGVLDRQDLSPYAQMRPAGADSFFNPTTAFQYQLSALTAGKPVFVDLQLRPRAESHLWYALNVFDWPQDTAGQIQDVDGATFAHLSPAQTAPAQTQLAPTDANGDMKLVPMLEIRMARQAANLPANEELLAYNVAVNDLTSDGATQVLYAPVRIITDERTGARLAFQARLPYLATGNWVTPHEVRLVWLVQALLDQCVEQKDGQCTAYAQRRNQPQVIQSYYDEWLLTGLTVTEEHQADLALIYEDPAVDPNVKDDGALTSLALGLDNSFLAGRDQDNNGQRDVDLAEIERRFDHQRNGAIAEEQRWGIPNTLRVVRHSYDTFDHALMTTAMTTTRQLLANVFDPLVQSDAGVRPLILAAHETRYRSQTLDGLVIQDGTVKQNANLLSISFALPDGAPTPIETSTGIKWTMFCPAPGFSGSTWRGCDTPELWNELTTRYGDKTRLTNDDTETALGRLVLLRSYFLLLAQGVANVVQEDSKIIPPLPGLLTDAGLAASLRSALTGGATVVALVVSIATFTDEATAIPLIRRLVGGLGAKDFVSELGLDGLAITKIKALWSAGRKGSVIAGGIVAGLVTLSVVGAMVFFKLSGNPVLEKAFQGVVVIGLVFAQTFSLVNKVFSAVQFAQRVLASNTYASLAPRIIRYTGALVGVTQKSLIVGAILQVTIVWGFFIYQAVSSKNTIFGPQFNAALAQSIASTILIISLAVLSATVIGTIIVTVIALIDAILTAICELGVDLLRQTPGFNGACFTLNTAATVVLAKLLYSFDTMVDTSAPDLVIAGGLETRLADPERGLVTGNPLTLRLPLTTTVIHKDPAIQNWMHILPYMSFFSTNNLRSTTFGYQISQGTPTIQVERGQMTDQWQVREHHKFAVSPMYQGQAAVTVGSTPLLLSAGINRNPNLLLGTAYAVPAYECWTVPNVLPPFLPPVLPICYVRTLEGNNTSPLTEFAFDILPPTLDEFAAQSADGNGGLRLAWDARFPLLRDADGDGLRSQGSQGIDPDDSNPDSDGDGIPDAGELEWRQMGLALSPVTWDSDGDGLGDGQELQLGADPSIKDTDNDGLLDSEELYHQVYTVQNGRAVPTNQWAGGWTVTITGTQPLSLIVSSDPALADSDRDGLSDQAERALATNADAKKRLDPDGRPYHPLLVNKNPLVVLVGVNDPDRIVKPGQSLTYDTVVANLGAPIATAGLEVRAPVALGTALNAYRLELDQQPVVTKTTNLVVADNAGGQTVSLTSLARARLTNPGVPPWRWLGPTVATLPSDNVPVHSSAVAPANYGRQDSYAISANAHNPIAEPAITAQRVFRGDIRSWAYPSGQSTTLEFDSANNIALRTDTASDVACNEAGLCFHVWDELDNCPTITLESIRATAQDEANGADLAIYLHQDTRFIQPGNAERVLLWNRADLPLNRDQAVGLSRILCGPAAELEVWEYDVAPPATNPTHGAGLYKLNRLNASDPNRLVFLGKAQDGNVAADLLAPRIPEIPNVIMGSLTKQSPLAVDKIRFPVTQSTFNTAVRDFRPVVASDGANFLVAWERVIGNFANGKWQMSSQIVTRLYDGSGAPISDETLIPVGESYLNQPQFMAQSFTVLDVAWIGDRYAVVWQGLQRPMLRWVEVNRQGAITPATLRILAGDANPTLTHTPRIAYEPAGRRTLVAYLDQALVAQGILLQNGVATSKISLTNERDLVNVNVAYHPAARGWLVAWAKANGLRYRLLNLDGAPFTGLVDQQQPWSQAEIAANGVNLACPVAAAQPALRLPFEEFAGAITFVDSSGWGANATCSGDGCPLAGTAGAPNAPLSDFGLRFNGVNQQLTVSVPGLSGATFSSLFWVNTTNASGDMGLVTAADWRVVLRNGKVVFESNANQLVSAKSLADGNWHHVAVVQNGNDRRLFIDGVQDAVAATGTPVATLQAPVNLRIGSYSDNSRFFNGAIDHLQLFDSALDGETVAGDMNRQLNSYCLATATGANLNLMRLNLQEQDTRGGVLTASNSVSLTIDAEPPTSQIDSLRDRKTIKGQRGVVNTVIIGGSASDDHGISQVTVSVDGGPFQAATGGATFLFSLTVSEGRHTITTRATDAAGNVEVALKTITIFVDAAAPTVTINQNQQTNGVTAATSSATAPSLRIFRSVEDEWTVNLSGAVSDPADAGATGSGIEKVSALLQSVNPSQSGNDWQPAKVENGGWALAYRFPPGLPDVSGYYTLTVQATDGAGNVGEAEQRIYLDGNGPDAELVPADAGRDLISANALRLSGVVSDVTGLGSVEVAFTPIRQAMAISGTVLVASFDDPVDARWFNDSSPFQHDLFCSSPVCPKAGESGKSDKALRFDGQASLRLPDAAKLDFDEATSFSVQVWLQTTAASGSLIAKQANNQGYALRLQNGRAVFTLNGVDLVVGNTPVNDGKWHQVAGVVDRASGQATLSVDGKAEGQAVFTGSVAVLTMLEVGANYSGLLDSVLIWQTAITPFIVEGLYQTGATGFLPATLAQANALNSTWSITTPLGLEGQYQIDLRTTDTLGNRALHAYAWRGVIDTKQPTITMTAQPTGKTFVDANGVTQFELAYDYAASDRHLDRSKFSGPCGDGETAQSETASDATMGGLFPDLTLLVRLSQRCNVWALSQTPTVRVNACDIYGNCASKTVDSASVDSRTVDSASVNQATVAAGVPIAQIVKPTSRSFVALYADRLVEVTVVARSEQPLQQLEILLDDAVVQTVGLTAAGAITATERAISVTLPVADLDQFEGEHRLGVRAVDVTGAAQRVVDPVVVFFDTHDPVLTLDNDKMTVADAYPTTNSMMRCHGVVSDTVGLATVQMKVDDSAWGDVTFDTAATGDGRWTTAWWVGPAAAGKVLTYHVRAIDRAGRVTEITKAMLTDVPVTPVVQTEITAGPEAVTEDQRATFTFTGQDSAGTPAANFLCQLDDAEFKACVSPVTYHDLSRGNHLFRVMALDGAGNFDVTPAQQRWQVGQVDAFPPPPNRSGMLYLPLVTNRPAVVNATATVSVTDSAPITATATVTVSIADSVPISDTEAVTVPITDSAPISTTDGNQSTAAEVDSVETDMNLYLPVVLR